MPLLDGFETTQRIRQHSEWQDLPVIAMTVDAMQQDRDACLMAGMNDCLSKPIAIERLRDMLMGSWRQCPLCGYATGMLSDCTGSVC